MFEKRAYQSQSRVKTLLQDGMDGVENKVGEKDPVAALIDLLSRARGRSAIFIHSQDQSHHEWTGFLTRKRHMRSETA